MGEAPVADYPQERALRAAAIERRLAEIQQRLAELRGATPALPDRAGPAAPDADTAVKSPWLARRHAADADRHWREAVAHRLLIHQMVVQAFSNAARAHEHTAEANERSARAGIGDVGEYLRRADFHRRAAETDREQARRLQAEDVETDLPG